MSRLNMKAIGKGFSCVLILALLSIFVLALVLYFTNVTEDHLPRIATIIQILAVLLGSTLAAKIAGCKGLFHGLAVAILFIILLMFLNFIWLHNPCTLMDWLKITAMLGLAGVIGGMIGVGLSEQS